MRNLLEEFNEDHGIRPPTILGVREHIFTGRSDKSISFVSFSNNKYMLFWYSFFFFVLGLYLIFYCICTSVSSLAWFMSNQETSFVTLGQRVLARPLKYVICTIFMLSNPMGVIT